MTKAGETLSFDATGDLNLQVMESADLARWEHRGDPLPELRTQLSPHVGERGRFVCRSTSTR